MILKFYDYPLRIFFNFENFGTSSSILGNDIEAGDIIFDYIPSAPYDTTTEGDNIDPAKGTSHRYSFCVNCKTLNLIVESFPIAFSYFSI